jgi:hypothetical protein
MAANYTCLSLSGQENDYSKSTHFIHSLGTMSRRDRGIIGKERQQGPLATRVQTIQPYSVQPPAHSQSLDHAVNCISHTLVLSLARPRCMIGHRREMHGRTAMSLQEYIDRLPIRHVINDTP